MQISCAVRFISVVLLCSIGFSVTAEEISLEHDGLTLNADLTLATGKTLADNSIVLITHGSLAHRDMEIIAYLRKLLQEHNYNSLAINLSLGLDNRHGMFDCNDTHRHRNTDAVEEIGTWVTWLNKQGVKSIVLLGHSRGGTQTALYAAERPDRKIRAQILLAPATKANTSPQTYLERYQKPLAQPLNKARQLIESGQGETVLTDIGFMQCRTASASAESFLSYYGQEPQLDAPYLIARTGLPTLVLVAGDDSIVIDLDQKVAPLADDPRIRMVVIDGADHMFRDLYAEDAVEAVHDYLSNL